MCPIRITITLIVRDGIQSWHNLGGWRATVVYLKC